MKRRELFAALFAVPAATVTACSVEVPIFSRGDEIDDLVSEQLRVELRRSIERDLTCTPELGSVNPGFDLISKSVMKIMKDVWVIPDRVVMHPIDWHALSTTATDGRLQFMDPTEATKNGVRGLPEVFAPVEEVSLTVDLSG